MFSLIDFGIFCYSIIQLLFLIHIVLLFVLSFFSICLVIQSEAKDLGNTKYNEIEHKVYILSK